MSWPELFLLLVGWIIAPLLLIALPLYLLFGGLRTFALRPLKRCFAGIPRHESPQQNDVQLVYHTYRGLLLWATQEEHRVWTPAPDAERLLGRLLRFNLTWGMLSYGMLFIPLLAVGNFYAQRKSIRKQASVASQNSPEQINQQTCT